MVKFQSLHFHNSVPVAFTVTVALSNSKEVGSIAYAFAKFFCFIFSFWSSSNLNSKFSDFKPLNSNFLTTLPIGLTSNLSLFSMKTALTSLPLLVLIFFDFHSLYLWIIWVRMQFFLL